MHRISWAPDDKHIVLSRGLYGYIIFNTETGKAVHESECGEVWGRKMVWSPDGKMLVSCSSYGVNCVSSAEPHDWVSGVRTLDDGNYNDVFWSPDSTKLALLSSGLPLIVLQVDQQQRLFTTTANCACCCWLKGGQQIATGCWMGSIYIWNGSTGALDLRIQAHTSYISNLTYLSNTNQLISCATDCTLKLWNLENSAMTSCGSWHTMDTVRELLPVKNTIYMVMRCDTGMHLWDLKSRTESHHWVFCKRLYVPPFAFSKTGRKLAIVSNSRLEILQNFGWNDKIHYLCSKEEKRIVFQLMCIRAHVQKQRAFVFLPMQMWLLVFSFLDFEIKIASDNWS